MYVSCYNYKLLKVERLIEINLLPKKIFIDNVILYFIVNGKNK